MPGQVRKHEAALASLLQEKWKTTERSKELSTAPRRSARQSLESCYYSSPDGNVPAHLLFSSSHSFHSKKMRLVSSSPLISPCSRRSLHPQLSREAPQHCCAALGPVSFSPSAGRKTACARSIPWAGGRCHSRGHVACTMGSRSAVPLLRQTQFQQELLA